MNQEIKNSYICTICNYGSDSGAEFITHLRKTHKIKKPPKTYYCPDCNYNTTKTDNYESHILCRHATIEERKNRFPFYCETCDFGVFCKISFNKHIITPKHIRRTK